MSKPPEEKGSFLKAEWPQRSSTAKDRSTADRAWILSEVDRRARTPSVTIDDLKTGKKFRVFPDQEAVIPDFSHEMLAAALRDIRQLISRDEHVKARQAIGLLSRYRRYDL